MKLKTHLMPPPVSVDFLRNMVDRIKSDTGNRHSALERLPRFYKSGTAIYLLAFAPNDRVDTTLMSDHSRALQLNYDIIDNVSNFIYNDYLENNCEDEDIVNFVTMLNEYFIKFFPTVQNCFNFEE